MSSMDNAVVLAVVAERMITLGGDAAVVKIYRYNRGNSLTFGAIVHVSADDAPVGRWHFFCDLEDTINFIAQRCPTWYRLSIFQIDAEFYELVIKYVAKMGGDIAARHWQYTFTKCCVGVD